MRMRSVSATAILLVISLSGCSWSTPNKGGAPSNAAAKGDGSADPVTASIFMISSSPSSDQFIPSQLIDQKFHIRMKWMLSSLDGFFDKLKVMIASNELSDLIAPLPVDIAKDIGPKGALVPLNRYFDQMPNLRKRFEQDKLAYASSEASDGNVYAAPAFDMNVNFRYVPTLRTDLLAETGLAAPETMDDLYQVLAAIKRKHPDSIGMINMEKTDALNDFGYNFNTNNGIFYDESKDRWEFGPLNEGYKEMIGYFRKLWNEKLLDREFFTASKLQWEAKALSGNASFWLSWPEYAYKYEKQYKDLHPNSSYKMMPILPLTTHSYNRKVIQGQFRTNTWTTIAISTKSKNTDRLVQLLDWMYSNEGSKALQFGVEGQTYTRVDGTNKYADTIKTGYNPNGKTDPAVLGIGQSGNLLLRVLRGDEYQSIPDYQKDTEAMLNTYRKNGYYHLLNNGISLTFTDQELNEKTRIESELQTLVTESAVEFITGEKSLADYDLFVKQLREHGAENLETIYNGAYAKYKETLQKIR